MLTVSEGLYEKLEAVGGKNKPSPFRTTGCGHLMGNFHPGCAEGEDAPPNGRTRDGKLTDHGRSRADCCRRYET